MMPLFLGPELRRLREQRRLKQAELARLLGVDPSVVGLWEGDKRPVPPYRLPALERALDWSFGIDVDSAQPDPQPPSDGTARVAWEAVRDAWLATQSTRLHGKALPVGRCADPLCGDPTCQRWRCSACGAYWLIRKGETHEHVCRAKERAA